MIDNQSVGCNWLSIMKLQPIPNPSIYDAPLPSIKLQVPVSAGSS